MPRKIRELVRDLKKSGWWLEPTTNPESQKALGAAQIKLETKVVKTLKHRDCQLWILLGFQLSLNNPGLLNRFEFQNNNNFQLLAQSLGCVLEPPPF